MLQAKPLVEVGAAHSPIDGQRKQNAEHRCRNDLNHGGGDSRQRAGSGREALESDAHEAVGAASDALLSHGRAQDVLAERLAPDGVERSSAGRGVQGKAVEAGTERLVEPERCVHEGG